MICISLPLSACCPTVGLSDRGLGMRMDVYPSVSLYVYADNAFFGSEVDGEHVVNQVVGST